MAGTASGGQQLTPDRNVTAKAGIGGDVWGANGGGITPVGNGVIDQTGYSKPIAVTLSDGETANNFQPSPTTGRNAAGVLISNTTWNKASILDNQITAGPTSSNQG